LQFLSLLSIVWDLLWLSMLFSEILLWLLLIQSGSFSLLCFSSSGLRFNLAIELRTGYRWVSSPVVGTFIETFYEEAHSWYCLRVNLLLRLFYYCFYYISFSIVMGHFLIWYILFKISDVYNFDPIKPTNTMPSPDNAP